MTDDNKEVNFPMRVTLSRDGSNEVYVSITEHQQQLQKARTEGYEQGYTQGKFDEKMDTEYKHPEELQKARHDWLREEIVRLEGMKYKIIPMEEHPIYSYETRTAAEHVLKEQAYEKHHRCKKYYNQALQTIIDRYLLELESIAQN